MPPSPLNWLLGLFSLDIGIDLGTANTLVYVRNKGIVINEPSWVAIDKKTRRPLAIGAEAKELAGRTPANIVAVRPIRDGVISEFEITQAMLEYFIAKAHEQSIVPIPRPRVVIGIPSGVTEVEKRAVYDAAVAAGARESYLIEEPMAAALGAGLPVGEARGTMVVDIGGGTTEVAVFSMGGIVVSRSLRVAGDEMDTDIITYARNKYNLLIGERMAERVKVTVGSAYPLREEKTITLRGRNLVSGLPESVEVSSIEVREALSGSVQTIIDSLKETIDETPPEIIADLMETGALSIAIIVMGQRGMLNSLESGLLAPLAPIQTFVAGVFNNIYNTLNAPSDLEALRARNAELEQQVAQLTGENAQLREAQAQLGVVSALLDYARDNPGRSYLAADVVGRDESLFLSYVLLNQGAGDGVGRDMIVVTDRGLVGTVTEVTANASKVLLITDASAAVNVRLQNSRTEGVVTGQQSGELRLNFIPVDVDLQPGELALTSGLGSQFPPGIVVGQVASVRKRTQDVFQEADITSAVDFQRLEVVLIITDFDKPDIVPLLGTATPAP
ncbi:MAG: rod shape-determining protein MreC [Chloroflexi bacterium]|nr:rod shape-determining protein MreC [Chloroflexota bacterium]